MISPCFRKVSLGTTGNVGSGCEELETEVGAVVGRMASGRRPREWWGHQIRAKQGSPQCVALCGVWQRGKEKH